MAKLGKALFLTTAAAAIAAGGLAIYNKYKASTDDFDDDYLDFDDEDLDDLDFEDEEDIEDEEDDSDNEADVKRDYVSLSNDVPKEEAPDDTKVNVNVKIEDDEDYLDDTIFSPNNNDNSDETNDEADNKNDEDSKSE